MDSAEILHTLRSKSKEWKGKPIRSKWENRWWVVSLVASIVKDDGENYLRANFTVFKTDSYITDQFIYDYFVSANPDVEVLEILESFKMPLPRAIGRFLDWRFK